MTFDDLSWLLVAVSLLGNVYVIKKNVIGQWLWAFGNLGWIFFDVYKEAYSQAFLFAVYLGMCIWGIIAWTKEAREKNAAAKTTP
ncbi:hypothetical protein [Estrella lausannensis]|uniref:Conserved putative membrane protein n=1 Tax=Estrella lausannensis TaxID=483423 RepID=A0A0H5DQ94_9BACT|nr:hypothetical protein [Estrella lausannensis]CRX38228.1 Conserved putative membrane protein [Estrella lausannensis]